MLFRSGNPIDLIEAAIRGIDMYDCVLPTRVARHGALMTHHGRMNINNEKFKEDFTPIAVSYTHLDVYKRQCLLLFVIIKISSIPLSTASCMIYWIVGISTICLLYTSRCV